MNLSFPISLLLSLALLIIIAIGSYSSWNKISVWRHPLTAAVLLWLFAIVNGIEGTWVLELQHSWAMYVIVVLLLFSLGLAICHKIQKTYSKALSLHTSKERLRLWLRKMPFLLLHTGAFLVLFGGFFGAPDKEDGQVLLEYGKPTHIAYQANGEMLPLPFDVQIDTFYVDYYADGRSPKQFTTRFTIREIGEGVNEGIKDERLNSLSDEGLKIKDERLNSAVSETSETNVISPSSFIPRKSFILHPSSFIPRDADHGGEPPMLVAWIPFLPKQLRPLAGRIQRAEGGARPVDRVRVGRYRAADDRRVLADDKAMESALGLVVGCGCRNHHIHRYHTRENQFRHPHARAA